VVVSRSENELDMDTMNRTLNGGLPETHAEPVMVAPAVAASR